MVYHRLSPKEISNQRKKREEDTSVTGKEQTNNIFVCNFQP